MKKKSNIVMRMLYFCAMLFACLLFSCSEDSSQVELPEEDFSEIEVNCFQNNRFYYTAETEPQQIFGILLTSKSSLELNDLRFDFGKTNIVDKLSNLCLYATGSEKEFEFASSKVKISNAKVLGNEIVFEDISFKTSGSLNYVWLTCEANSADFRDTLDAVCNSITLNDKQITKDQSGDFFINNPSPEPLTIVDIPAGKRVVAYHRIDRIVTWTDYFHAGTFDYVTDILLGSVSANAAGTGIEFEESKFAAAVFKVKETIGERMVNICVSVMNHPDAKNFDAMVINANKRVSFAKALTQLLLKYDLNGIDIDREGAWTQNEAKLKDGWASFLKQLRIEFAPYNFYISGATSPDYYPYTAPFIQYYDLVHVMNYDAGGKHSTMSYFKNGLTQVKSRGPKKFRITAGVPFYSHETRSNRNWEAALGFNDIVRNYPTGYDASGNYIVDSDLFTHDGQEHFYNSYNTLKEKAQYIVDNNYAGVMIWSSDHDIDPMIDHSPWKPLIFALGEVFGKKSLND